MLRLLLLACILLTAVACANQASSSVPHNRPAISPVDTICTPTDQDQYVWHPARLQFLWPCVRAVGAVLEVSAVEPDGDVHIHLRLDPPYQPLLNEGNAREGGYLVVEAVCQYIPQHVEALRICASDPDPYLEPLPHVGDHIWVEGRYILDMWHHAQAELHPLYRWGIVKP